jgi:acid phosphatase family membrane protein YuiD
VTALTEAFVAVKPDMDKFGPEVKKKLAKIDARKEGASVAGRFGVGFNGAFGGIVKHSAGLFVGAFAAIKGAQVFGGFIKDAAESAKVSRLTTAVIKSTGGAAKITAGQVGDLATAISNKTGADDETIQSGANLLLTFTNIRNAVGKNNDIFNQATSTVTDMAAALNGGEVSASGVKSASIQLGKALNDPIKGVTALQKVGVSFTDDQKKQIKTLVESGKTMEAQKVILAELNKEFGGAAAAAGDPFVRLKTIMGNLGEEIGGYLLPVASKFADWVSGKAIPGLSALFGLFKSGDVAGFAKAFNVAPDSGLIKFLTGLRSIAITVFTTVKDGINGFVTAFKEGGGEVQTTGFYGFMERLGLIAQKTFGFFKTEVIPRLKDFAGFVKDEVVPRLKDFGGFLKDTVVPAVGNLISAFKPLAGDVANAVGALADKLWPVLQDVGGFIKDTVVPAIKDFTGWLKDNSTVVGAVAVGIGAAVAALYIYKGVVATISAVTKAWTAIQAAFNVVMSLNPIGVIIIALVALAAGLVYAYKKSETFRNVVNGVFNAVKDVAGKVFGAVVGFVKGAIDWVKKNWPLLLGVLTGPIGLAVVLIAQHWQAIKDGARTAIAFVVDKFLFLVQSLINGAATAFGWVPGLGPKLKEAASKFETFRKDVNTKLAGINDQEVTITPVVLAAQAARRKSVQDRLDRTDSHYATGGRVRGPGTGTSDSIPAMLSNGEHVWTAREVSAAGGHGAVEQMRASVIKGFAKGGAVKFDVTGQFPNTTRAANSIAATAVAVAKPIAQALGNALGGISPGLKGVLAFVKSQVGKPYVWGGVGPGGYDCSGLVSAAINVALGRRPYSRIGATGSMPWPMFASGPGAFEVGWFTGSPGHTAATVNGVNIESRGGRGVVMGAAARGARNALFTRHAHVKGFAGGGRVSGSGGDAAFDVLDPRGKAFAGREVLRALGIEDFDTGGRWRSGTLGVNLSGKTETVVPGDGPMTVQLSRHDRQLLRAVADRSITLDGRRVDEAFSRRALGGGY